MLQNRTKEREMFVVLFKHYSTVQKRELIVDLLKCYSVGWAPFDVSGLLLFLLLFPGADEIRGSLHLLLHSVHLILCDLFSFLTRFGGVFDGVKHWSELGQPMPIHCCHALHVFLARESSSQNLMITPGNVYI